MSIAHDTGIDRVELRRRNFIPPTPSRTRRRWRCNTTAATTTRRCDAALKAADWAGFEARRAEAAAARQAARHRHLHLYRGLRHRAVARVVGSLGARAGLYEVANVRVHPTGSVTVFTGTHSHGQGHETTFAQLVADQLGVPLDAGRDRARRYRRRSRSAWAPMAAAASPSAARRWSRRWTRSIAKGKKIAAHLMEASVEDIEFKDGKFTVAGTDKSKTLDRDLARRLRAAQLPDRGAGARAGRDRVLRPEELHLPRRLPYLRGRDRPRHRRGRRW